MASINRSFEDLLFHVRVCVSTNQTNLAGLYKGLNRRILKRVVPGDYAKIAECQEFHVLAANALRELMPTRNITNDDGKNFVRAMTWASLEVSIMHEPPATANFLRSISNDQIRDGLEMELSNAFEALGSNIYMFQEVIVAFDNLNQHLASHGDGC